MPTYDGDIIAWAREQADLLRARQFHLLDVEHVAEEIEDLGKSEQRALASRMAVLLAHLLQWETQPESRGASRESTIREQRRALLRRLRHTPSLRRCLEDPECWEDAWLDARTEAARETGLGFETFPEVCPWAAATVLGEGPGGS